MVTESEKKKGYVPRILVHRWNCNKCDFKYYFEQNTKREKDNIRFTKIEAEISIHVMKTNHEVTHYEQEPFRMFRI